MKQSQVFPANSHTDIISRFSEYLSLFEVILHVYHFKHTRDSINVFEWNVKNLLMNSKFVYSDVRALNDKQKSKVRSLWNSKWEELPLC
jgi:hypothetical protein